MSSKKKKTPKDPKDKAAAPPLDSLQRSLQEPAAEDGDDDGLDQVSNASHSTSLSSSAHSLQDPSDQSNDFITSLGIKMSPELEALVAMVNSRNPAFFQDSVLVARQVLDSGRDLATIPPEIFVQFCQSDVRTQLCQLLVHDRLASFSLTDLLKAVPLLRDGVPVSELVAAVVAPSGSVARASSAPSAQQSLLLNTDEAKDLESFTKVLENAKKWDFAQAVRVMTTERSMTPAVIADLTRILKASFPFDKLFPGGFGGLNFLQLLSLSPLATAAHMGMVVNGLTEELNFNGEHQGFFFAGSTTASIAPIFAPPLSGGIGSKQQ